MGSTSFRTGTIYLYRKGYADKKAGVILTGLDPVALYQDSLLRQYGADEKSTRLMSVLDQLNQEYGRNTISVFSAGDKKNWAMRWENYLPVTRRNGVITHSAYFLIVSGASAYCILLE